MSESARELQAVAADAFGWRARHVIERLGHPPVVATTATASLPVRRDIIERLGLRNHVEVVASFDRPNLRLAVEHHSDERAKREAVLHRVDALLSAPTARLGLVYTASRKDAESYAADLRKAGRRADHYHAGRRRADRERVHEDFQQNRLDIVVATSAFGMGIDKADVRFVVHVSAPESLDSYYQQIGRAGRDGEGSEVVLFYRPEDLHLQRFLTSHRAPTTALAKIANVLAETEQPMTTAELAELVEVPTVQRVRAVNLLEQAGAVTADAEGRLVYVDRDRTPTDAVAEAVRVAEAHQQLIRSRIEMMRGYAETTGCRRQFLLGYFGESLPEPCGNCDTCAAAADRPEPEPVRDEGAIAESPDSDVAFSVDDPVRHRAWGTGVVMSVEDDRMTVLFDEVGYKTLDLAALTKHKLLTLDEP
jgi:ATP-dependent DNA helicase RecQ